MPHAGSPPSYLLAAALALSTWGCTETCDRPATEEPIPYRGGEAVDGVYMTADWDGEFLQYHGGAFYEIHHQLGAVPSDVQVYLSFERYGTSAGSVAAVTGNLAEIKLVDEEKIWLLNGTCTDAWALVVIEL